MAYHQPTQNKQLAALAHAMTVGVDLPGLNEFGARKTAYTFVVNPFDLEVTVAAHSERQARSLLWDSMLSDGVKDGCESIECVEQRAA